MAFHSFFLNAGKVGYDGDDVVESALTTTAYSCDVRIREHTGQGLDPALQVCKLAHNKRPERTRTLPALTMEGDCVLDFCLERLTLRNKQPFHVNT